MNASHPAETVIDKEEDRFGREDYHRISDSGDLSPLEDFASIDEYLSRGGDEAFRVSFILEHYGGSTKTKQPTKPRLPRYSTADFPDEAVPCGQSRGLNGRRLGLSRKH